ncbi:MAG: hypothetical protein ACFE9Q_04395 [Candidatus Hodarchaeota archaeon]
MSEFVLLELARTTMFLIGTLNFAIVCIKRCDLISWLPAYIAGSTTGFTISNFSIALAKEFPKFSIFSAVSFKKITISFKILKSLVSIPESI